MSSCPLQPFRFPESQGCDSITKDFAVSLCSCGCQAVPPARALSLCGRRDVHGRIQASFPGQTPADAHALQVLKPFQHPAL